MKMGYKLISYIIAGVLMITCAYIFDLKSYFIKPIKEEAAVSEDQSSRQVAHAHTTPSQTTPNASTAGQTTSSQTVTRQNTPGQTTAGQITPAQSASGKIIPSQSTPSQSTPGQTNPAQVTPQVKNEIREGKVVGGPLELTKTAATANNAPNNNDLNKNLHKFPQPKLEAGKEIDANLLFDWCLAVEKIYQSGMFNAASAINKKDKYVVQAWLQTIYSEELTTKRINAAYMEVEDGFKIVNSRDVFDLSPASIEKVNKLELTSEGKDYRLLADITVKVNTGVVLEYKLSRKDAAWLIDDYKFSFKKVNSVGDGTNG